MSDLLELQNRIIIALLARATIGVPRIREIVESRKGKKREAYIEAYNSLDGSKSITEVAKELKVVESTFREMLKLWEDKGIVYRMGQGKGAKYVGLLKLPLNAGKQSATEEGGVGLELGRRKNK